MELLGAVFLVTVVIALIVIALTGWSAKERRRRRRIRKFSEGTYIGNNAWVWEREGKHRDS